MLYQSPYWPKVAMKSGACPQPRLRCEKSPVQDICVTKLRMTQRLTTTLTAGKRTRSDRNRARVCPQGTQGTSSSHWAQVPADPD